MEIVEKRLVHALDHSRSFSIVRFWPQSFKCRFYDRLLREKGGGCQSREIAEWVI